MVSSGFVPVFLGYIDAVVSLLLGDLVGFDDVADGFCSESCHVFEFLECVPLRDVQEFLLGEYSFHVFFVVEAS